MLTVAILFLGQLWEHAVVTFELISCGRLSGNTLNADRLFQTFLVANLVLTLVIICVLEHFWSKTGKQDEGAEPPPAK
jgi:hypothetical protein